MPLLPHRRPLRACLAALVLLRTCLAALVLLRACLAALVPMLAAIGGAGATPQPGAASPIALCRAAIAQAEREAGLPPRLLAAIGRVESGRRDPETGAFGPWPWTVNAEGRGSFYPDRAAAIAAVRALQAQGVRSIDVGCLQINLRHHPAAFASLEEAFDPLANARYAARFLTELQASRGDWMRSAAHYHSQTPEYADSYRARVAAAWEAERGAPAGPELAGGAIRGPGSLFGAGGPGAAMLENAGPRTAAALLPVAAGSGGGRSLDAYRAQPIPLTGRVTAQATLARTAPAPAAMPAGTVAPGALPAAAPAPAQPGLPMLAAPTLGLPPPGRPATATPAPASAAPAMLRQAPPAIPAPGRPVPAAAGFATAPMLSLFGAPRPAGPLIPLPGAAERRS